MKLIKIACCSIYDFEMFLSEKKKFDAENVIDILFAYLILKCCHACNRS